MNAALNALLGWMLGQLGQLIAALIRELRKARADNPELLAAIGKAVAEAETNVAWTGSQKRSYVYGQALLWCKDFSVDVRDSVINALIELAVVQITPPKA